MGQMNKERWKTQGEQMQKMKLITKTPETDKFFQDF